MEEKGDLRRRNIFASFKTTILIDVKKNTFVEIKITYRELSKREK